MARSDSLAISYYVEPEQNIALARNRAVRHASGEFLAFIDDDEYPDPQWLGTLYAAIIKANVDAVLGPVLPYFTAKPPDWIVRARIFDRPRPATGTPLDWTMTRTGNILLRRDAFSDDLLFRAVFGGGGEDRDCFRRMIRAGKQFIWCDEAPVHEAITPERCKTTVLMRRALLRGKIPYNHNWHSVLKSVFALPVYGFALPWLWLWRRDLCMKYLISSCDHLGRIMAVLRIPIIKEKYIT